MTLGLALLTSAFPPETRGAALGLFSAVTGLAVASGPLVGGAVVDGLAWQWIFWLNVPVGLLAAPLVLRLDPRGPGARTAGSTCPAWRCWPAGSSVSSGRWSAASPPAGPAPRCSAPPPPGSRCWPASRPGSGGRRTRCCRRGCCGCAASRPATSPCALTFAALFSAVFFYGQLLQVVMAESPLGAGVRLMAWTGTFLVLLPVGRCARRPDRRAPAGHGRADVQAAAMVWFATTVGHRPDLPRHARPVRGRRARGLAGDPVRPERGRGRGRRPRRRDRLGRQRTMRELGGVLGIAVTVAVFGSAAASRPRRLRRRLPRRGARRGRAVAARSGGRFRLPARRPAPDDACGRRRGRPSAEAA